MYHLSGYQNTQNILIIFKNPLVKFLVMFPPSDPYVPQIIYDVIQPHRCIFRA